MSSYETGTHKGEVAFRNPLCLYRKVIQSVPFDYFDHFQAKMPKK